jgi:hypothetical protein
VVVCKNNHLHVLMHCAHNYSATVPVHNPECRQPILQENSRLKASNVKTPTPTVSISPYFPQHSRFLTSALQQFSSSSEPTLECKRCRRNDRSHFSTVGLPVLSTQEPCRSHVCQPNAPSSRLPQRTLTWSPQHSYTSVNPFLGSQAH